MDEWDVEAVVAWFNSVGYSKFDANLREHQARARDERLPPFCCCKKILTQHTHTKKQVRTRPVACREAPSFFHSDNLFGGVGTKQASLTIPRNHAAN